MSARSTVVAVLCVHVSTVVGRHVQESLALELQECHYYPHHKAALYERQGSMTEAYPDARMQQARTIASSGIAPRRIPTTSLM